MKLHSIQIAQSIQQHGLSCSNNGLMHGNIGMCIFFYQLFRNTSNPDYEKIAGALLDKAFNNMSKLDSADFENGLAGIGWGIEYLIQQNFIEVESDEIFEEVDNKVFRILNEDYQTSFELENGLSGYLFYLIKRLSYKKAPFSMAYGINRELFILTINKIDELVTAQFPNIIKEVQFDLFWRFPVILFGLTEAFKLNIYNEKICCIINQWSSYFEAYIPSLHINRLFLAVVLKQIDSMMPDKRLEKQIEILLFATDFEVLKTEVDHSVLNIRFGWPGVALLLDVATKKFSKDWPNYQLIGQTYHALTEKHSDPLENLPMFIHEESTIQFGLTLGLSGIGLEELLWPWILSGNC